VNRASAGLAHGTTAMSEQEYKGYKKILQANVFHGSRTKVNVTLIALSRHVVALELYIWFK
jgi:hypothetical protein